MFPLTSLTPSPITRMHPMRYQKKAFALLPWFVLASAAFVAMPGCEDNNGFEDAGEELDEAADEVEDAVD
jgi:hypothetical protein